MKNATRNLHDEFERLVSTMDIPGFRKTASAANARWFLRNAGITNMSHRNFEYARKAAIKLSSIN